jgi:hypothetical protein
MSEIRLEVNIHVTNVSQDNAHRNLSVAFRNGIL